MPDITLTTDRLIVLAPVLGAVEKLSPPPTPKGRYALAKAAAQVGPAFQLYVELEQKEIQRCGVKNDKDEVVAKVLPSGGIGFDLLPDLKDEYNAAIKAMRSEEVTLTGVRQITHAELGVCPITAEQERVLIASGLLEDIEPV